LAIFFFKIGKIYKEKEWGVKDFSLAVKRYDFVTTLAPLDGGAINVIIFMGWEKMPNLGMVVHKCNKKT